MKVMSRLVALASVTVIAGAALATAGVASASSGTAIHNNRGEYLEDAFGFRQPVYVTTTTVLATPFVQVNKSYWSGNKNRPTYEYQEAGTDACLEYSGTPGSGFNKVILDTCTSGRASQQFWRGSFNQQLVNVYASGPTQYDGQACLDVFASVAVILSCQSNDATQIWNW